MLHAACADGTHGDSVFMMPLTGSSTGELFALPNPQLFYDDLEPNAQHQQQQQTAQDPSANSSPNQHNSLVPVNRNGRTRYEPANLPAVLPAPPSCSDNDCEPQQSCVLKSFISCLQLIRH